MLFSHLYYHLQKVSERIEQNCFGGYSSSLAMIDRLCLSEIQNQCHFMVNTFV